MEASKVLQFQKMAILSIYLFIYLSLYLAIHSIYRYVFLSVRVYEMNAYRHILTYFGFAFRCEALRKEVSSGMGDTGSCC